MLFGFDTQNFWDLLKRIAERLRISAEFITAIVLLFGAVAGFWPQISTAVHIVSGWVAAGPWWLKYVFLVGGIAASIGIYVRRRTANELIRVLSGKQLLTIADNQGKSAKLEESTYIKARVNEVDSYIHTQWGTGPHAEPKIWADGYNTSIKVLGVREGLFVFALEFDPPLRRGTKLWQHYRCEVTDTFPKKKEFMQHRPHYREKDFRMEVCFPNDRLPTKVRALSLVGETIREHAILKPATDNQGNPQPNRYAWRIGRTALDRRYRIEWEW